MTLLERFASSAPHVLVDIFVKFSFGGMLCRWISDIINANCIMAAKDPDGDSPEEYKIWKKNTPFL
jgi:hypothetical protein